MMEKIYLMYGDQSEKMAIAILEEMKIEEELLKLGKGKEQLLIGIKPNLVVAQPAHWGATTCPDLVKGVIKYLRTKGFNNLIILESAWVGDSTEKAFEVCGFKEISQQYQVPLVDLKQDKTKKITAGGVEIELCEQALTVDYLINMPVLKAHCQTKFTCALKNLKGCVPDKEKRRFHRIGLHLPIAYLSKALSPQLTVVDGIIGDLTYEGGGTPVRMNRVIASRDPVAVDAYGAQLIGYAVEEIPYITMAAQLGVGSLEDIDGRIVELNNDKEALLPESLLASEEADYLSNWIEEKEACSACYGSLVHGLMRLKERGQLKQLKEKVHLGQGFKNMAADKIGIGLCTKDFSSNVKGCPPKAKDILALLEQRLKK
ncbi:MAG: DUF362 domain-containing protein [Bacillota bacterium]|nr:DUF362 domain-containing protein [Bacillota bacterium]